MIAPRGITGVTQDVTTEDRLCILVNLVARLGVLWHEHAVVIREEDPRGSCALINAADELTTLVEKYFGDVLHCERSKMLRTLAELIAHRLSGHAQDQWKRQVDQLVDDLVDEIERAS